MGQAKEQWQAMGSPEFIPARAVSAAPRLPRTITYTGADGATHQFRWAIDAEKLRSRERQAVSPAFDVPFGPPTSFRIVLVPVMTGTHQRGQPTFKRSGGQGNVFLKCEVGHGVASFAVRFTISISNGCLERPKEIRG